MYEIAKLSDKERELIFRNTANKMQVSEAIIEKDFWVVLVLDYLFSKSKYKTAFTFKGGTSLSKGYSLIRRFSEDIDLILDWTVLGVPQDEPFETRSNRQQEIYNNQLNLKASAFIKSELLTEIKDGLSELLDIEIQMEMDSSEEQTVIFKYPRLQSNDSILNVIRLEFGPLAAPTPSEVIPISPYISHFYPNIFNQASTNVLTVTPSRTFWEKVTILHHEAYRPKTRKLPDRYSRHYYDLYMMSFGISIEQLLLEMDLLDRVVGFKQRFYPRNWANYELAKKGTLKLVPDKNRITELEIDYKLMQDMLFGVKPSFSEIIDKLTELEKRINN